jgi:hypothetical protein
MEEIGMSVSTLYAVYKTKASPIRDFQNGWGTAPIIWGYLNKRFLGGEPFMPVFGDMKPVWDLWCDPKVPEPLRAANAICLDHAVVTPGTGRRMAVNLRRAHEIMVGDGVSWSHFSAIADAMEEHKIDHCAHGFGLSCTSVSDPWLSWSGDRDGEPWDILGSMDAIIEAEKTPAAHK